MVFAKGILSIAFCAAALGDAFCGSFRWLRNNLLLLESVLDSYT